MWLMGNHGGKKDSVRALCYQRRSMTCNLQGEYCAGASAARRRGRAGARAIRGLI